ncbi:hypothetical protein HDV00_009922, partial [Rhizophlyctis rosea]
MVSDIDTTSGKANPNSTTRLPTSTPDGANATPNSSDSKVYHWRVDNPSSGASAFATPMTSGSSLAAAASASGLDPSHTEALKQMQNNFRVRPLPRGNKQAARQPDALPAGMVSVPFVMSPSLADSAGYQQPPKKKMIMPAGPDGVVQPQVVQSVVLINGIPYLSTQLQPGPVAGEAKEYPKAPPVGRPRKKPLKEEKGPPKWKGPSETKWPQIPASSPQKVWMQLVIYDYIGAEGWRNPDQKPFPNNGIVYPNLSFCPPNDPTHFYRKPIIIVAPHLQYPDLVPVESIQCPACRKVGEIHSRGVAGRPGQVFGLDSTFSVLLWGYACKSCKKCFQSNSGKFVRSMPGVVRRGWPVVQNEGFGGGLTRECAEFFRGVVVGGGVFWPLAGLKLRKMGKGKGKGGEAV